MAPLFIMMLNMQRNGNISKALPQTYGASRYGNGVTMGKLKVLLRLKKILLDIK